MSKGDHADVVVARATGSVLQSLLNSTDDVAVTKDVSRDKQKARPVRPPQWLWQFVAAYSGHEVTTVPSSGRPFELNPALTQAVAAFGAQVDKLLLSKPQALLPSHEPSPQDATSKERRVAPALNAHGDEADVSEPPAPVPNASGLSSSTTVIATDSSTASHLPVAVHDASRDTNSVWLARWFHWSLGALSSATDEVDTRMDAGSSSIPSVPLVATVKASTDASLPDLVVTEPTIIFTRSDASVAPASSETPHAAVPPVRDVHSQPGTGMQSSAPTDKVSVQHPGGDSSRHPRLGDKSSPLPTVGSDGMKPSITTMNAATKLVTTVPPLNDVGGTPDDWRQPTSQPLSTLVSQDAERVIRSVDAFADFVLSWSDNVARSVSSVVPRVMLSQQLNPLSKSAADAFAEEAVRIREEYSEGRGGTTARQGSGDVEAEERQNVSVSAHLFSLRGRLSKLAHLVTSLRK